MYYTHGCPFTAKYVPLVQQTAKDKDIPFESVLIDSKEKAQNAPIMCELSLTEVGRISDLS